MFIHSKSFRIFLAVILTIFVSSQAEAQLWGKLKSAVKKKAEEVVTKEVSEKPQKTAKETKNQEVLWQEPKSVSVQNDVYEEYTANSIAKNSPDIVGLKLGMTPDQIVSALKARNKDFKIETRLHSQNRNNEKILRDHEYVESLTARSPNGEFLSVRFSAPPNENFSTYIRRGVSFDENNRPLSKNVIAGLTKKYGPVTNQILSRKWLYRMNGELVDKNSKIPRSCARLRFSGGTYKSMSCNYYVVVAQAGEEKDIISGLMVSLRNPYLQARSSEKTEKYIVDLKEAAIKKRNEDASKVKVDIDF